MRELRRPTDVHDFVARLKEFRTPEAEAAAANFETRPDDVFICTYSKSGTTWMQQVVHQLRTGGSMDFLDISVVVPWIESAIDYGIDPAAPQPWSPRAYKAHLMWQHVPRGGRYITIFRDPVTVLPSFYRFLAGWWFEPESVSIEEFARELYFKGSTSGRHWEHLIDWYPRVGDDDVLALTYEDMLAVPDRVPHVVADFLGLEPTDEQMAKVVHHSSRAFMNSHASRFDEDLLRSLRDPVWGLPPGGESTKVTTGSQIVLSAEILAEMHEVWRESVTAELGFESYREFRYSLPDPLGVRS